MMSVGILGRGRQAGVLEAVDAGGEPAADLLGPVRVRDDRLAVLVRLVHDGAHFVHRHLVLIDQLDDVDAGVGELLAPSRARRRRPLTPQRYASVLGIRLVLDERARRRRASRRESCRALMRVAHGDARLERPAEVARAGDAGHQQLLRRRPA